MTVVTANSDGSVDSMRSTIDAAGRLVIPKAVRGRLGLGPGAVVELTERDGLVEVAIGPVEVHIEERAYGPVLVPETRTADLTDADVRAALEQGRR